MGYSLVRRGRFELFGLIWGLPDPAGNEGRKKISWTKRGKKANDQSGILSKQSNPHRSRDQIGDLRLRDVTSHNVEGNRQKKGGLESYKLRPGAHEKPPCYKPLVVDLETSG